MTHDDEPREGAEPEGMSPEHAARLKAWSAGGMKPASAEVMGEGHAVQAEAEALSEVVPAANVAADDDAEEEVHSYADRPPWEPEAGECAVCPNMIPDERLAVAPRARTCSPECGTELARRRAADKERRRRRAARGASQRTCAMCKKEIPMERHALARTCSPKCQANLRRFQVRRNVQLHRARKSGKAPTGTAIPPSARPEGAEGAEW